MKTILNKCMVLLCAVVVFASCAQDEMQYDKTAVNAVSELKAPATDVTVDLYTLAEAQCMFEWAAAPGGGAPGYEIAFCKEDGQEVYRINAGTPFIPTKQGVSHSLLNEIAGKAGIAAGAAGDLYWRVITTQGNGSAVSALRKLPVKRYSKIDDVPVSLYVTGAASEGGADLSKAARFRNNGDGTFQVFTQLTAGGNYVFVNNNAGAGRTFTGLSGVLSEGESPMTVAATSVYKIVVDFTKNAVTTTAIGTMNYYYYQSSSAYGTTAMNYEGYGVWKLRPTLGTLTDGTNMYKFFATVAGTNRGFAASSTKTAAPAILEGDYFYITQLTSTWSTNNATNRNNNTFRHMVALSNQSVDIYLDLSSNVATYTHRIDPGDLTVVPVSAFTAPAAGALLTLAAGSDATFSWTAPASTGGPKPRYDVIFYSDAAGTNQIGSVTATGNGFDASATIPHATLETYAEAAGIAKEAQGSIWWSVKTTVISSSKMATIAPREVKIKRMPGAPTTLFLTGSATEFGATLSAAKQMRSVGTGIFEIYTKIASGTFNFVDNTSGTHRTFTASGTTLSESTTAASTTASTSW